MPLMPGAKTFDPVENFNTGGGVDPHPCIGLYYASPTGHVLVSPATPLPVTGGGGGGVGITDTDDNSIAELQTTLLAIVENYIDNGSTWIRWQGGVDNGVAPVSPQIGFVGGVVTDPVDVFADGDVSALHFDTSGRLLVSGSVTVTPFATTDDDDAVAPGAFLEYLINLNYGFDGFEWRRHNVRSASVNISESLMYLLTRAAVSGIDPDALVGARMTPVVASDMNASSDVAMTRVGLLVNARLATYDRGTLDFGIPSQDNCDILVTTGRDPGFVNGIYTNSFTSGYDVAGDLIRAIAAETPDGGVLSVANLTWALATIAGLHGFDGTDWRPGTISANNVSAPGTPNGLFTAGIVRTSFDVFAAGDAFVPQGTVDGAVIAISRTQEPFEVVNSQATIAASGVFTSAAVQQNSLFAGSLGRHSLQGFMHYAGAASSVTIEIQVSLDGGATFITTDTFTVVSGATSVFRGICVAMGNRVRIRVTNNDAVNSTGVTNIGFYLTHAT